MHSPMLKIWELIIQSKDNFTKKQYYIAYVEILTSQVLMTHMLKMVLAAF